METNKANKLEALDFADKIFAVVSSKQFRENVKDPNVRLQFLINKYPEFSRCYPVVLRWMASFRYKRHVFEQFLDKLERDPGKGMEGYIERQADYAMLLSLAYDKRKNKKKAYKIREQEICKMNEIMKKIKKDEEDQTNLFEEEKQRNLEERRKELLQFIKSFPTEKETIDPIVEDANRLLFGLPLKNPKPSFNDIDVEKLTKEELGMLLREMTIYENELKENLKKRDEYIAYLESKNVPVAITEEEMLESEWLKDTCEVLLRKRKKKFQRK
jgi:hypothetical protein